ncbi:type II secretion system GspH family protein [Patescibacteria group bacterium]|nr:type II secretion system GspH family protein [Patescibacteria group bacterium]
MSKRGFTLIELIIVIAVISILAGAIFVAVDPARRLHETRNARRWSDVTTILDAIKKYQADNEGEHYFEIYDAEEDAYHILNEDSLFCDSGCLAIEEEIDGSDDCVDLNDIGTNYLAIVPVDPKIGDGYYTGYYMIIDSNGAITVGACEPEGEGSGGDGTAPEIKVTR